MRHDFVGGVAFVDGRLEDLYALARDFRAAQTADQLFALAGKHGADNDFDPAHIAFDDVHDCSLESSFQFSVFSFQFSVFSKKINLECFSLYSSRFSRNEFGELSATAGHDLSYPYVCEFAAAAVPYILAL